MRFRATEQWTKYMRNPTASAVQSIKNVFHFLFISAHDLILSNSLTEYAYSLCRICGVLILLMSCIKRKWRICSIRHHLLPSVNYIWPMSLNYWPWAKLSWFRKLIFCPKYWKWIVTIDWGKFIIVVAASPSNTWNWTIVLIWAY